MGFAHGLILANRGLFEPLVRRSMATKPETEATIRTTTAVTQLQGSVKTTCCHGGRPRS